MFVRPNNDQTKELIQQIRQSAEVANKLHLDKFNDSFNHVALLQLINSFESLLQNPAAPAEDKFEALETVEAEAMKVKSKLGNFIHKADKEKAKLSNLFSSQPNITQEAEKAIEKAYVSLKENLK